MIFKQKSDPGGDNYCLVFNTNRLFCLRNVEQTLILSFLTGMSFILWAAFDLKMHKSS